jgi:hypothetical protein
MATRTKTVRRNAERKRALPTSPKAGSIELADAPASLTQEDAKKLLKSVIKASKAAGPLKAINTNLTSELNNIDFKKMIGGPLQACVDAQVASSLATINFINEVGFKTVDGKKELIMVDFSHTRNDVKADGTADNKTVNIRIPLIAMLPIPSLRIDHVTIDFNVKLNSVETSQVSSAFDMAAEVKGGWGPVSFKVSASYQRKSTTGVEVKKEYALNVNVKAVQDEIPAGLEKILNMLAA